MDQKIGPTNYETKEAKPNPNKQIEQQGYKAYDHNQSVLEDTPQDKMDKLNG